MNGEFFDAAGSQLKVVSNTQLPQNSVCDAVVPAASIRTSITDTDLIQIQYRDIKAVCFETGGRCRNQAGLAAAVRRDDVRIPSADDCLVEQIVSATAYVPCLDRMQRRANAEEITARIRPGLCSPGFGLVRLVVHDGKPGPGLLYSLQLSVTPPAPARHFGKTLPLSFAMMSE